MGRAILLDRPAVARRLGIAPNSVDTIRRRVLRDQAAGLDVVPFPEPVPADEVIGKRVVAMSQHSKQKLWRQSDIDRFARATGRTIHAEN
jgi:hypothetical protein